jgi:hypothetical protein
LPGAERNMMQNTDVKYKYKSKMEEYATRHIRGVKILGAWLTILYGGA